jgi:hypothetical protein
MIKLSAASLLRWDVRGADSSDPTPKTFLILYTRPEPPRDDVTGGFCRFTDREERLITPLVINAKP